MKINEDFIKELAVFKAQKIPDKYGGASNILLFKNYLNTMKQWCKVLDLNFSYNLMRYKDRNDLIRILFPELRKELLDMDFYRLNLLEGVSIQTNQYRSFDYLYLYYYIYWNVLKAEYPTVFEPYLHLPHPYESVCRLLLNGGSVECFEGYLSVSVDQFYYEISKDTASVDFSLPSMEGGFMNYIDVQYNLLAPEGGYKNNILDQEKVNALWGEYQALSGDTRL
ncbi:hypothetical protein [Chryseobacterium arthrosphaerae]|uniref:hypothetical protein n=1 Tax=Chryseobacterium arthrosphaerae TaxID=651561 RepID=UPI0031D0640C